MASPVAANRLPAKSLLQAQMIQLPDDVAKHLVQLLKLLADDTRLRILHLLLQRNELNVRTLCELLQQSQPAVSHHLALLRVSGLIDCRRDGKHNYYRVLPSGFQQLLTMMLAALPAEETRRRLAHFIQQAC